MANFDSVASRWHESCSEEGEWRERRGLITHVSNSQNFSRNGSVGTRDTELVRKSSSGKFGKKTPPKIKETSNPAPHTMQLNDSEAWTVISKETVVLQPRAKHVVPGNVLGGNFRNFPRLLCVEPAHVPIEGICVARGLSYPSVGMHRKPPVRRSAPPTSCTEVDTQALDFPHDFKADKQLSGAQDLSYPPDSVMLMITNFSDEALTLPKGTTIGVAQAISEDLVVSVSDDECINEYGKQSFYSGNNKEVPTRFKKYVDEKLAHLSESDKKVMKPVLIKYADIFHDDEENDFRSTDIVVYKIETGEAAPIRKPPYKTPYALRQEMEKQVQKMLDKGVIRPSHSPWASPVVLVPKRTEN
jgi:hypothetical protein